MGVFVVVMFFTVLSWLIYLCITNDTPIYGPRHIPATRPSKGHKETDEPYNPFSNKVTPIMRKAKKR